MYGYGIPDTRPEDSPDELHAFRERYANAIKSILPVEKDYSTKSHLYEAVYIASGSPVCCDNIVEKIFHTLWPEDVQDGLLEDEQLYLYGTAVALGEGSLEGEKKAKIQAALSDLFAV